MATRAPIQNRETAGNQAMDTEPRSRVSLKCMIVRRGPVIATVITLGPLMAKYVELDQDMKLQFEQYRNAVEQIERCKLLTSLDDITCSFFPADAPYMAELDRDELISFLTTLRQFTLQKSPTHFTSVCKLLRRQCDNENARKWAIYFRDHWLHTMKSTPFSRENEALNVEETLNLFIYSGLVKSEAKQYKQLKALAPGVAEFMMVNIPAVASMLVNDLRMIDGLVDLYQNDTLHTAPAFNNDD